MAKNYIQAGDVVTLTAPYAVSSGGGALVGNLFGIALQTLANAASGEFAVCGVFDINKLSTDIFAVGDFVYWDNTNKRLTSTSAGNTKIGVAIVAAGNPSSTVRVLLNESR